MNRSEVLRAWGRILTGRTPSLSIEITKECPLRCPGCYAFDEAHLGGSTGLRELSDYRGEELVSRILAVVDEHKPLHLSLVGGDPLVRYRELEQLLPELDRREIHTQVVTSAFRVIPGEWMRWKRVNVVVSIDGLPEDHDVRRKPATYERILKNTEDARITIHCTITAQIAGRPGYLEEFIAFWSGRKQVRKIWFSIFTPQRGASNAETLSPWKRAYVLTDLRALQHKYPKLEMPEPVLRELERPPGSPAECIFARTTETLSADLKTRIAPCQFGGDPDCQQCGCIASMALAAVGHHRVAGSLTAGTIFGASERVGRVANRFRKRRAPAPAPTASPFTILESGTSKGKTGTYE